jgi:hypothetical protein
MRFKEFKEGFQDLDSDDDDSGEDGLLKSFFNLAKGVAGGEMKSLAKNNPMLKKFFGADQPTQPGQSRTPPNSAGSQTVRPTTTKASTPVSTAPSKVPAGSQQISSYLASKGLSRAHVAGIMANIKHESNFNPAAIGDGGTSGGLFQHHGPRFQAMVRAAGRNWKTNWQGQIDFALSEPAGRQYASIPFKSAEEASKWFTMNFEIPANKVAKANDRSRSARQYG